MSLWGPLETLRNTLAASSAFQTLVGADPYYPTDEALDRIYIDLIDRPANDGESFAASEWDTLRPFALLYYPDNGYSLTRVALGNYKCSATVHIRLEVSMSSLTGATEVALAESFYELVGDIVEDLAELTDSGQGYADIQSIRLGRGRQRTSQAEAEGTAGTSTGLGWAEGIDRKSVV